MKAIEIKRLRSESSGLPIVVLGMLSLALAGITCLAHAEDIAAPRITAIRAQLYYEENGSLSDDILARDFALWNTIIGEGDAASASNFTLVTVEISGAHVPSGTLSAEISATVDGNIVLEKRQIPVALYDDKTKFYAPLWLYGTGCQAVHISARLTDNGVETSVDRKTIPFECGE
jgi:hypothetical protein